MLFKVKDNGFTLDMQHFTSQTAYIELIPKSSLGHVCGLSYLCH